MTQDPASANAAATNKAITLNLAKQIASVGGDPQQALKSGTFKPGNVNDATGKGNSCDTADDQEGCIFSQNLLVPDATAAEIAAAAGGKGSAANSGAARTGKAAQAMPLATGTAAAAISTGTGTATAGSANGAPFANSSTAGTGSSSCSAGSATSSTSPAAGSAPAAASSGSAAASGINVQAFTGSLGGPPPPVTSSAASERPFSVNGSTFVNAGAALQRSCSVQHNACADAANSGKLEGGVGQCNKQEDQCNAAAKTG